MEFLTTLSCKVTADILKEAKVSKASEEDAALFDNTIYNALSM